MNRQETELRRQETGDRRQEQEVEIFDRRMADEVSRRAAAW
jgi:hypothetical protein